MFPSVKYVRNKKSGLQSHEWLERSPLFIKLQARFFDKVIERQFFNTRSSLGKNWESGAGGVASQSRGDSTSERRRFLWCPKVLGNDVLDETGSIQYSVMVSHSSPVWTCHGMHSARRERTHQEIQVLTMILVAMKSSRGILSSLISVINDL